MPKQLRVRSRDAICSPIRHSLLARGRRNNPLFLPSWYLDELVSFARPSPHCRAVNQRSELVCANVLLFNFHVKHLFRSSQNVFRPITEWILPFTGQNVGFQFVQEVSMDASYLEEFIFDQMMAVKLIEPGNFRIKSKGPFETKLPQYFTEGVVGVINEKRLRKLTASPPGPNEEKWDSSSSRRRSKRNAPGESLAVHSQKKGMNESTPLPLPSPPRPPLPQAREKENEFLVVRSLALRGCDLETGYIPRSDHYQHQYEPGDLIIRLLIVCCPRRSAEMSSNSLSTQLEVGRLLWDGHIPSYSTTYLPQIVAVTLLLCFCISHMEKTASRMYGGLLSPGMIGSFGGFMPPPPPSNFYDLAALQQQQQQQRLLQQRPSSNSAASTTSTSGTSNASSTTAASGGGAEASSPSSTSALHSDLFNAARSAATFPPPRRFLPPTLLLCFRQNSRRKN
ncbi:unnamed protein product [Mesocestoides corti]|uniref:Velvet domain-containing protein n=1 Tax=Mesocestoides corti TaxID=53468 RepID=A0A0R3UGU2_MESCO|nr:unnamed protein product [Mesocestoides corti]